MSTCTCAHAHSWSAGGKSAFGVVDLDERQWLRRQRLWSLEFALFEHDEREPRNEPLPVRRCSRRRVAPEEVLVVELDERQVVRLEVHDRAARLAAHDRACLDADHITRPVQRYVALERLGELTTAADSVAAQQHRHRNLAAEASRRRILRVDAEPLPCPGEERVGRERGAHAAKFLSIAGMTCTCFRSAGSFATLSAKNCSASVRDAKMALLPMLVLSLVKATT